MARAVLRLLCHVALEPSFHGLFPESMKGRPRYPVGQPAIRGPAVAASPMPIAASEPNPSVARVSQSISSR